MQEISRKENSKESIISVLSHMLSSFLRADETVQTKEAWRKDYRKQTPEPTWMGF